jgi:TonB family protein
MLNKFIFFAIILSCGLPILGQQPSPTPAPKRYTVPANGGTGIELETKGAITGGVLNGKAEALPPPVYPRAAMAVRASGVVLVQVLIDEEGKVVYASAVSGHPLLRGAAVAAAKGARFSPTKLAGQPVKVSGIITYNFVGQEKPEQTVMALGYDLADAEITRSISVDAIKGSIPSAWQEERLLIDEIAAAAEKYSKENPPKIETDEKAAPPPKSETDEAKTDVNQPPRDPNVSMSYRGPVSANRYTIVGSSTGSPAKRVVNINPETSADIAELQKKIAQRFTGNELAAWYFRYGQILAGLRAPVSDETRFASAVSDLGGLIAGIPAASAEGLRPRLEKLALAAEAARGDVSKRSELLALINELRSR